MDGVSQQKVQIIFNSPELHPGEREFSPLRVYYGIEDELLVWIVATRKTYLASPS